MKSPQGKIQIVRDVARIQGKRLIQNDAGPNYYICEVTCPFCGGRQIVGFGGWAAIKCPECFGFMRRPGKGGM